MAIAKDKKARLISLENKLKSKVGSGGIPAHLIEKAQKYIDDNPTEYKPDGLETLKRIQSLLTELETATNAQRPVLIEKLIAEVMRLKASGAMFRYDLVSMIADVLLDFLETVRTMNPDVMEIIKAHNEIISVVLNREMKGGGGKEGTALSRELFKACARYYEKHEK